jgi:DNA-binding NtrC family response regulator
MKPATVALLVMPAERRRLLIQSLRPLHLEILAVENCQQAHRLLKTHPPVEVVITDLSLSDGNWCDVFRYVIDNGISASLVVTSRLADERLWSEVLWRGAHDMLVEPFDSSEVLRIVEGALRAVRTTSAGELSASAGRAS